MKTIASDVAGAQFPQLLERVAQGETLLIVKGGRAIAQLSPAPPNRSDTAEVIRRMKELRRGNSLGGITVRELIEEGRRY